MEETTKDIPELSVAEQLVVVRVVATAFSGKQVIDPIRDLGQEVASTLPPADLLRLGNKQLVDPAALRPFPKLRQRATRACLSVGTRIFGDAVAVPEAKFAALLTELEAIAAEWNIARDNFIADYPRLVAVWADQHPAWRGNLLSMAPPAASVAERFSFSVVPFKVGAAGPLGAAALTAELDGLSGQMLREIAQDAQEALTASFSGKAEVTRRALRPLKAIQDKVEGLEFLSVGCGKLTNYIREALADAPKSGPIDGSYLLRLTFLLEWLTNPQNPHRVFFVDSGEQPPVFTMPVAPKAEEQQIELPLAEELAEEAVVPPPAEEPAPNSESTPVQVVDNIWAF